MHLDIVTPRKTLVRAEVDEFTAPGILGEFGVLPGHIPLLTGLKPGVIRYRTAKSAGGELGVIAVSSGYVEVAPGDRIVVLASQGEPASEIDVGAAREQLRAAQDRLDHWEGDDPGARATVEEERDWAQARLDAAGAGSAAVPARPAH